MLSICSRSIFRRQARKCKSLDLSVGASKEDLYSMYRIYVFRVSPWVCTFFHIRSVERGMQNHGKGPGTGNRFWTEAVTWMKCSLYHRHADFMVPRGSEKAQAPDRADLCRLAVKVSREMNSKGEVRKQRLQSLRDCGVV